MEPMRWHPMGVVVSRHLRRIEEYTPLGASPRGFCEGSLEPPAERTRTEHNHVTRNIMKPGKCPGCDAYHARHAKR